MLTKIYETKTGKATLRKTNNFLFEADIRIESGQVFEYNKHNRSYHFVATDLQHYANRRASF